MADLVPPTDETKKRPRYYEGVYSDERTISTKGDITPISLRSPISRGIFNLPRYFPKHTINSRLHGKYADEVVSDSNTSQTFDRKYKDANYVHSDYLKDVPVFPDKPDDVEASYSDTRKSEEVKGRKKLLTEPKSEGCLKCSLANCCTPKCCTPKCRRITCALIIVALVAAALLALALGLYFGYFMQFRDSYPMTANLTVTNVSFPDYLSNLSHPQTLNLTNAICDAFKKTLENVSQIYVDLSSCSAVSYTSGSIYAIFNIEVRHRRDQFINNEDAFVSEVRSRLTREFNLTRAGYFAIPVARSIPDRYKPAGDNFSIILNGISPGHFSPQDTPWTSTVTTSMTTTKSTITTSTSKTPKNSATSTGKSTGPSALSTTSVAKTSRTADPLISVHTDSSTDIKPSSTQTIPPSSTIRPTIHPSSTQSPTIHPSSTQSPTIHPSSTQSPTIHPSSTQSPTIHPSSTERPTVYPSSNQSPTIPPISIQHSTTTVPAPTTTATVRLDTSTTATTTATTPIPNIGQSTTSEGSTSGSHFTTSNAALN